MSENAEREAEADVVTEERSIPWVDRIPLGLAFRLM